MGKAQRNFQRAEQASGSERDVMANWLLQGLEHLIRAVLARTSPTLNADQDFMVDAALGRENSKAKTIPITMAIKRLTQLVPAFADGRHKEPTEHLVHLRNSEMHSGLAALDVPVEGWLPRFTRVAQVLCAHLGVDANDVIGKSIIDWGVRLVDEQDEKLSREISKRIRDAIARFEAMPEPVRTAREAALPAASWVTGFFTWDHSYPMVDKGSGAVRWLIEPPKVVVTCPACKNKVWMEMSEVRRTPERLEGESVLIDVILVATRFACSVCELTLNSTAEIRAAGLAQQHTELIIEDLAERYLEPEGPEYGDE